MKRTLCLFVMLFLFCPACSHAPGTQDVLPFQDKDVTAVDIRYKCFLSESYIAELTQAERIQALLKTLRAQQVISLNASAVEAGGAADSFYFTFHLSDGQLYTAGLCEAPASESNAASFENDVIRFNVKYESESFMEFLSNIADWTPVAEANQYPPHYGYTMPGDLPCTTYPYFLGGTSAPRPTGVEEVLPFSDGEAVSLTVYSRSFSDAPNYSMTVTEASDIAAVLDKMRGFQIWNYNHDGISRYTGELFFSFLLDSGQLYTVGYTGACQNEESMSFENDSVRLEVVRDTDFIDFVRALDYEHVPSDPPRKYAVPQLGYSQPGDPLCTAYPYTSGSAQEQSGA